MWVPLPINPQHAELALPCRVGDVGKRLSNRLTTTLEGNHPRMRFRDRIGINYREARVGNTGSRVKVQYGPLAKPSTRQPRARHDQQFGVTSPGHSNRPRRRSNEVATQGDQRFPDRRCASTWCAIAPADFTELASESTTSRWAMISWIVTKRPFRTPHGKRILNPSGEGTRVAHGHSPEDVRPRCCYSGCVNAIVSGEQTIENRAAIRPANKLSQQNDAGGSEESTSPSVRTPAVGDVSSGPQISQRPQRDAATWNSPNDFRRTCFSRTATVRAVGESVAIIQRPIKNTAETNVQTGVFSFEKRGQRDSEPATLTEQLISKSPRLPIRPHLLVKFATA